MKALILCAGQGSRFNTNEYKIPKCLIKINQRKLIDIQISALYKNDIKDIAIVTGFNSKFIDNSNIKKFYTNEKWKTTNMIYSLFCAGDWLNSDDCIISYGDIFYNDLTIKSLITSEKELNILYHTRFLKMWTGRYKNPLEDLESLKIDESGYLTNIGEKCMEIDSIMGQFMGLIYLKKTGWQKFKNELDKIDIKNIDFTKALQFLINKGYKIKGIPTEELWGEIDTEKDLEFYESYYANRL